MFEDITFITVNYNALSWITDLVNFFSTLEAPFTFSLTVVDNNSADGSQNFLQSCPAIKYIQTGENIGYGRAINRGVAATASKYICVTNTDVILNRDALSALWRFLERRDDVGVCAPRITYADGRDQGMVFRRSLFPYYAYWVAKLLSFRAKSKIGRAKHPLKVDGVMGSFFLLRRSVMPGALLFDEDFFFFHEDIALAHTLYEQGVQCFIVPNVTIIHVGGASGSTDAVSAFYDSKYLYLKKFYGGFHAKVIYLLDRVRILRKWLSYSLFSLLTDSKRIKSKQRYYRVAWETFRWR